MNRIGIRYSFFMFTVLLLLPAYPLSASAGEPGGLSPNSPGDHTISFGGLERQNPTALDQPQLALRENRCLTAARWMGVFGGSVMGVMTLYFNAAGVDGAEGSFGQQLLGSVSSIALGSYAGVKMSRWMAGRIMRGNPKPFRAGLRGAMYGVLSGAVTVTASLAPLLIAGKALGTIDYNNDPNYVELLGSSALGGTMFGGFDGLLFGCVYGPAVSIYMRY